MTVETTGTLPETQAAAAAAGGSGALRGVHTLSMAKAITAGLREAMRNDDAFTRFAAAGLAMLFATQSAINMAVNLRLIPAKGMTLPFISYGGSSMISLAYAMGMLLALTREQPRAAMLSGTVLEPEPAAAN